MHPCLHTLGLLLLAAPAAGQGLAPDGWRSLGAEDEHSEILALFRKPTDEDEAFLEELQALEPEVAVLAETAEGLARARGYFTGLGPRAEPTWETLAEALEELLATPEPRLSRGGEAGRTWARMLLDHRLRLRMRVLAGWRDDARDLRRGIAVLRAETDGWVRLEEEEARVVAMRVDLAGALLRARVKDLSALRESPGAPSEVREEEVDRLLAVVTGPPGVERQQALDAELLRVSRAVEAAGEVLFTTRLRESAEEWIRWREDQLGQAERMRAEVRRWRPDTEEGRDAPRDVKRLKKTERRRQAYSRAMVGMAADPLDDELAYAAGQMAEFVVGALETVDHYDRFLALRGVRVYALPRGRELSEEETHAVFQIQQFESGFERPGEGG